MCSKTKVRKLDFAFARLLTGKSTPLISKAKCSSAECFSKSLIGRKIRRRFRSSDEAFWLRSAPLEAALKCRSCKKGRYALPVHMIKHTETADITSYIY